MTPEFGALNPIMPGWSLHVPDGVVDAARGGEICIRVAVARSGERGALSQSACTTP